MQFPRDTTIEGLRDEWSSFGALVRGLSSDEWTAPTRCVGWETRDVAGHIVGTLADVVAGVANTYTGDDQAAQRRGRSPAELADELERSIAGLEPMIAAVDDQVWDAASPWRRRPRRPADPEGPPITIRAAFLTLWHDTWTHGDDIRTAIGRASDAGDGMRATIVHAAGLLTDRAWGPATLAPTGMEDVVIGDGVGPRITGDPYRLAMVLTGRASPDEFGLDPDVNIYA